MDILFNLYPCFAWIEIAWKVQQRERNLTRLLFSVELVAVTALEVLVQLILRRETFRASGHRAREVSAFCVPLNVSLELSLVVEERRTQITSVFAARGDLGFDRDPMRSQMMVELGHSVELLRTLAAYVLLDLMMSFHVVVQVGYLGKRPAAVHLNANEWPFACVQSSVVVQVCYLRERFAAVDATMKEFL